MLTTGRTIPAGWTARTGLNNSTKGNTPVPTLQCPPGIGKRRTPVKPTDPVTPVTLEALAQDKRLPEPFLADLGVHDLDGGGVGIPYYGPTGEELFVRQRDVPGRSQRFHQPPGVPLVVYGQDRLDQANQAGFLILVEGESDCWALWHQDLPALGIPGSSAWKTLEAEHVAGVNKVYIHREPDQGGNTFVKGVVARLKQLRFEGKVFELRMPDGIKDPADLHALDPQQFRPRLETAIKGAHPLEVNTQAEGGGAQGGTDTLHYVVHEGAICRRRVARDSGEPYLESLCNFQARIVEEVVHDDGSEEPHYHLVLTGQLASGPPLPRAEVPASEFAGMGWVLPTWGSRAVVNAGQGAKDHLRAAIQSLSAPERRTVYQHSGWRQVGGEWVYLHGGGCVCRKCQVSGVVVELPGALQQMTLPQPPTGQDLADAIRASLALLDLAPLRITAPVLGAVYRAPLGASDLSVHLAGPSGAFKTELAALAQRHYGTGFGSRNLPGNWSSTGNATEGLAFAAKDMVVVVDDFAPCGGPADVARYHKEADRLFRNAGNQAARQRMRPDGTLRAPRPPRCLFLSTGEEVPRGHSVRARLVTVEMSKGEITSERLSRCQAEAGRYAGAMAGYLSWLAGRYEGVHAEVRDRLARLRGDLRDGQAQAHARTPSNVAQLTIGLDFFLQFAEGTGAIDAARRAALKARIDAALREVGQAQEEQQVDAEPTAHFLRLLRSCIGSGRAHVAGVKGEEPAAGPAAWGWRPRQVGSGDQAREEWQPQGRRVGWLDGGNLYLDPEAAHAEAQRFATEKGEAMGLTTRTLGKRLHEKGVLKATDQSRETLMVRKVLEGQSRAVWNLDAGAFFPPEKPDKPDSPGPPRAQPLTTRQEPPSGPVSENRPSLDNPTGEPDRGAEGNGGNVGNVGSAEGGEGAEAGGSPPDDSELL
jgi:hypothetical protein